MEAALVNHAGPGDRVVVINHGHFGDLFVEIGETYGMRVDVLRAPWGTHAEPSALAALIGAGDPPRVVTMTSR